MTETKRDDIKRSLMAARRLRAITDARDNLMSYMKLTVPDAKDPEDAAKSRYIETAHGRLLCQIMEKIERRELKRVAVSIGPQFGKSEILSRKGPAWISGRDPFANLILGTYNQPMADTFGRQVRDVATSPASQQVFPGYDLNTGMANYLVTQKGGQMSFVGVGGSGTGKPADFFFVDDPIKSAEEANSETFRESLWDWFNGVVFTRCHDDTAILVVHTRWHEDDLIGRLCDPEHPWRTDEKHKHVGRGWTYINLPAVVTDPKLAEALGLKLDIPTDDFVVEQFGKKPMSSLWPGRKSLPLLAEARGQDPQTFNALYMGKPTPDDGEYFKDTMLVEYHSLGQLPKNLRKYGASDHAVSEKQTADFTVLGCVGVDEDDDIWVLPDVVWERMETDRTVEELLSQFQIHEPQLWWMESELISKSFGPFLYKRMAEERIYTAIDPVTVSKDKRTRARAIQGRMSMKRVHFPAFAPWWPQARSQLLKFPYGKNDDFVDWLAHIGKGLVKEIRAEPQQKKSNVVSVGSAKWVLAQTKLRAMKEKRQKATAGW
jgi:predicted phage terminase large subunit-like protein